jgi:hypothetical protein
MSARRISVDAMIGNEKPARAGVAVPHVRSAALLRP